MQSVFARVHQGQLALWAWTVFPFCRTYARLRMGSHALQGTR